MSGTGGGITIGMPSGAMNPNTVGVKTPTSLDPVFFRFFGGETNQSQLALNQTFRGTSSATVLGTPTIQPGYATFVPGTSGINLHQYAPPNAGTLIVCAEVPTWTGTAPYTAPLISSANSDFTGNFSGAYISAGGTLASGVGASSAAQANLAFPAAGTLGAATTWFVAAMTYTLNGATVLYNLSSGASNAGTVGSAPALNVANFFIGTSPNQNNNNTNQVAPVNISAAGLFNYALTSAELQAMYKSIQAYMLRFSITV